MGSFSLVHEVEKMSLVIRSRCVCSPNPLISYSTCICCKTASGISITLLILVLILVAVLTGITLSQLGHEVAVEHGLSHLGLLLGLGKLVVLRSSCVETANASLVEHLLLV